MTRIWRPLHRNSLRNPLRVLGDPLVCPSQRQEEILLVAFNQSEPAYQADDALLYPSRDATPKSCVKADP